MAVTMPLTLVTVWPTSGDCCWAPWMARISVAGAAAAVVKFSSYEPDIAFGVPSTSWTAAPSIVTEQLAPFGSAAFGSSENDVAEPEGGVSANGTAAPLQTNANALAGAVTV